MKTISFTVSITFNEEVDDPSSIKNVLNNVYDAVVSQYENGNGLAPNDSNALTEKIEIIENSTKQTLTYKTVNYHDKQG